MMIELAAAAMMLANMDPEGVVATAPRGDQAVPSATAAMLAASTTDVSPSTTVQSAAPHGLSTDQQIARWIGERTAETSSNPPADPWAEADAGPRKMHGQISVGMGTGGYRDYAAAVSLPLGENATLNLSVSQTKNSPWGYGYGYGSPWGYGGYGRPFGAAEPFGYDGLDYRSRVRAPLRMRSNGRAEDVTTNSAGVSLRIGGD